MPDQRRHMERPHPDYLVEDVALAQFTDGGGAAGTFQLSGEIPAGARLMDGMLVQVTEAFAGDTTAVLIVGDGSDTDRYMTGTPSVFTTGHKDMGAPSGTKVLATANRPTLTVTSGSDFGLITGGKLRISIPYHLPKL